MVKSLPKWVFTDRFDIEAKSENHSPTKDQMRLMLQVVLEDRFKLAVRRETRQLPLFALALQKAGKTGPQLKQHTDDSPCLARDPVSSPISAPADTILKAWPPNCGHIRIIGTDKTIRLAGRDVSMGMIADVLTETNEFPGDRLVVDQPWRTDTFDIVMDFANESPSIVRHSGPIFGRNDGI